MEETMEHHNQAFDIFLSYSHLDGSKVGRLVERLKADGFTLWIDEEQIGGGDPLRKVMVEGIENSTHVFVCLSPSYLESKWTTFESAVSQAIDPDNRVRRLVPVKIEPCKIPVEYAWLYCPNLTGEVDWQKEYAKAVKNVKETKVEVKASSRQPSGVDAPDSSEIESLLTSLKHKRPDVNRETVRRAYLFLRELCTKAQLLGKPVVRLNGDPYVSHPLSVAETLVGLAMDSETVAAGLLHDAIEDFGEELGVANQAITHLFGSTTFELVDGVTNVKALHGGTDRLGSVIKLFKAAIEDPRILMIKLADRHHNMATLEGWNGTPRKQKEIAEVTRSLYVPLADQFGLWAIKRNLEDACFKYLERPDYDRIVKRTNEMKSHPSSGQLLREIKTMLQSKLDLALGKDVVRTTWRDRHLYSIYLREKKDDLDFDNIFDLKSLRVVVPDERRCYEALYCVDQVFPYYFSFRRIQKAPPNEYKAFHMKVTDRAGRRVTIHLCTEESARLEDLGLATYYHPEWGKNRDLGRVGCLGRLVKISESRPETFLLALREDVFFKDIIFVRSPIGETVYDMRKGSNLGDFAERVRPKGADRIATATINGREAKLTTSLEDGQIVQIDWDLNPA